MHDLSSKSWTLHLPRQVVFGRGACAQLPLLLRRRGWQKPVIVTDRGVWGAGLAADVAEALKQEGFPVRVFAKVTPEPPFDVVEQAAAFLGQEGGCDCVIGLGGGSVMDAAKVALAVHEKGVRVDALAGIGKVVTRATGIVQIPTTAGTGSEATFVAILTDPKTQLKVGVVDPALLADLVIIDPALTDSQPAAVTAASGIDAIVHAVEAAIAKVATPLAQGMALEALRYLGASLRAACAPGVNQKARDDMALGSHFAGMAFANSSCCAVHALALPLGGRFHIPHGVCTGVLAGAVMRHNAPACASAFPELAAALGWNANAGFGDQFDALARDVGITAAIRSFTIPASTVPELARDAVTIRRLMDPNPRDVTVADAERIYREVLNLH